MILVGWDNLMKFWFFVEDDFTRLGQFDFFVEDDFSRLGQFDENLIFLWEVILVG